MNTIHLKEAVARNPQVRLAEPVSLDFGGDEHLVIMGPNGAGKTLLVNMILGKYPLLKGELTYDFSPLSSQSVYECIKYLAFRDVSGMADGAYYQQRWNMHDQDEAPLVRDYLGPLAVQETVDGLFRYFKLDSLLDKKMLLLSSGELRKVQIVKALAAAPRVLILDNPFIGLDSEARDLLRYLLQELTELGCLQLILVISQPHDIPDFITHVVPVDERRVGPKLDAETFRATFQVYDAEIREAEKPVFQSVRQHILDLSYSNRTPLETDEVVTLNRVSIRYGEHTILKDLDWTVHKGERWALSGENGSGKSTLLSLVCADNPQSYACDIALFGRKRGSGESIWDIKKRIGYVSPEMHRSYLKNLPAIEIVASGLHDSIGLYKKTRPEDFAICQWWMEIFGVGHLRDKLFLQLSDGEQRLLLLARAFVKDPELLILDEPMHGLDVFNRRRLKVILEAFCERKDKTLIMVTHEEEEWPACITHHLKIVSNKNKYE